MSGAFLLGSIYQLRYNINENLTDFLLV